MKENNSTQSDAIRLSVIGMSCAGCVKAVEDALHSVDGVELANVNFADHSAIIAGHPNVDELRKAVVKVGYDVAVMEALEDPLQQQKQEQSHYQELLKKTAVATVFGVPLMIAGHLGMLPELGAENSTGFWLLVAMLTFFVMVYSGGHFYVGAFQLLRKGQANMDTLIALGTGSAWVYSTIVISFSDALPSLAQHAYFEAAIIILAFINFGSALETRARGQTSGAIRALLGLQPRSARVVREGNEMDIPIDQVGIGEILRVRPGEKLAVDGIIVDGHSTVDESMLTGESIPIEKTTEDEVISGTINQKGSFLYKATRIGRDTVLAQIIESVRKAQGSKPEIARLVDRIAAVFVPVVVVISVLTFLVWSLIGPQPTLGYAFVTSMTVLLIACPCALGLATPISIMVAVGRAAQVGILIRNGDALQNASKLTCILLDKTGTVTEGRPRVAAIETQDDWTEEKVLAVAATIEAGSEHPLATAICDAAQQADVKSLSVGNFEATSGKGVAAEVEGERMLLGNVALMQSEKIDCGTFLDRMDDYSDQGQTPVLLATAECVVALISVSDPIKPDSKQAIIELKHSGHRLIMVTGDNKKAAAAIAKAAGISEVRAEVLPNDKAALVADLQRQGEIVGMVGDGVNDAPALAQADVGFAIGTGTDIAIESCDVVLIQGSLRKVSEAISLSNKTLTNIKQNLTGAFIYNILSIPVAAGLLYPFFGVLLNPMIAGAAMAMSSVTVVSNANRLRWQ